MPAASFPADFLWGVATAGHQNEGDNVDSDTWFLENVTPTVFQERSGQGRERVGAVGVRPRPRRGHEPQRVPLLGRVGAHRARRGRVLRGGARALRSARRRMPRPRPRADRDVQPLHVAALVRRTRRVARRRSARALRALLRRRDGSLRRPHPPRRHVQRARPARDADLGGAARLHRRPGARDPRGSRAGGRGRALPRRQRHAARGLRRACGRA